MKTSIATVSLSGDLRDKLEAIARAGFDGVEIFENDFLIFDESPKEVGRMVRDLGMEITLFQPFRDFEGMPEPLRSRTFDRAERKFDLMQEMGTDRCSSVRTSRRHQSAVSTGRRQISMNSASAPPGAACASATRRSPGAATSMIIAMPGRSSGGPIIKASV